MSIDYNKITKEFLLGEAIKPSALSYFQSMGEILDNIKTKISGKRRLEIARSHLREIRRNFRRLNEKIQTLEEQVKVLEENKDK